MHGSHGFLAIAFMLHRNLKFSLEEKYSTIRYGKLHRLDFHHAYVLVCRMLIIWICVDSYSENKGKDSIEDYFVLLK